MKGWALVAIVVANVIGGTTYLAQKMALPGLPPATITLLRNLLAMGCLFGWAAASGGLRLGFTRREHVRLALLGVLAYATPLLLGIVGLRHSTAGNGSILILLEPVAIVFFARILLGEAVRGGQAAGLLLGLLGALVIVLEGADAADLFSGAHLQGNLILAAHGVLWGLFSPLMAPLLQRHRSLDVTFAAMAWALVLLLPAALLEAPGWQAGPALAPALLWTVALGVIGSFGGTLLWVWSLRALSPGTVAPFVFLQPLAGVLAGHLVLAEVLSEQALLGGALIGAGVLLVILPTLRTKGPASSLPSA